MRALLDTAGADPSHLGMVAAAPAAASILTAEGAEAAAKKSLKNLRFGGGILFFFAMKNIFFCEIDEFFLFFFAKLMKNLK